MNNWVQSAWTLQKHKSFLRFQSAWTRSNSKWERPGLQVNRFQPIRQEIYVTTLAQSGKGWDALDLVCFVARRPGGYRQKIHRYRRVHDRLTRLITPWIENNRAGTEPVQALGKSPPRFPQVEAIHGGPRIHPAGTRSKSPRSSSSTR